MVLESRWRPGSLGKEVSVTEFCREGSMVESWVVQNLDRSEYMCGQPPGGTPGRHEIRWRSFHSPPTFSHRWGDLNWSQSFMNRSGGSPI